MKRLIVALASIGLTAAAGAYAALPAATDPTLVNVPQLPGGFVVGVSGYYLEPSPTDGDLDFASANINASNSVSNTFFSKLYNVDPGYNWGWGANIGYIFPNTGNDVNLSYFYLDTGNENQNVFISPFNNNGTNNNVTPIVNNFVFNTVAIPDLEIPIFLDPVLTNAAAEVSYRINQVDLTAGQFINVGCRLRLHPNVGLRYADLERKINSVYSGTASFLSTVAEPGASTFDEISSFAAVREDSDFSGIGPLAGIDASYYIGMGFGAVAHADAALLIGTVDSETDVFAQNIINQGENLLAPITIINAGVFSYRDDSTRRVVPVGDLKLGLDYTYLFNNAANSDLTLEIGWQASEYYNAVDRLATVSTVPSTLAVGSSQTLGSFTSSVGLDGPYATLTLHV